MTTKLARDAARALTNGQAFKRGNLTVANQLIKINECVGYDRAQVLTLYSSRIAYVHCGMLYVSIPEGCDTRTTIDKVNAVLDMWGKGEYLTQLQREQGRFLNLGRMN